jgi:hypothetical protein
MLKASPNYPAVIIQSTTMTHSATFGKIQQQQEPKKKVGTRFQENRSFTMNLSSIRER